MKKNLFIILLGLCVFSDNLFAKELVTFRKVELKNPINKNFGFEAGAPKTMVEKVIQPKTQTKYVIDVLPVEEKVVEKVEVVEEKEVPTQISKEVDFSQTDKNIEEAKALLKAAEKLANSVKEEDFEEVKPSNSLENPNISVKFKKNSENISTSDEKKLSDIAKKSKNNEDTTFKIVSYYIDNANRNIAFSRLLNTRKVLLDNGITTSQTVIMVLEDETNGKVKENLVEIFISK